MRLLVINPNTSQFVTDRICDVAGKTLGPRATVRGVTGSDGPRIVGNRAECAWAAGEALRLARGEAGSFDAVLLGISFDTGLEALRQDLGVPVVGMSEAGMLLAMTVARRFAMLTFGGYAVPLYEELIAQYGFQDRSAGVLSLPALSQAELENPRLVLPQLEAAITAAAKTRGAEAVVLAGAIFAGLAAELRDRTPIPVVDGIVAATGLVECLHALGLRKPSLGSFSKPA
ncbi:MAG: hypothetical protein J0L76_00500 [Rhodobacterales bacterium]|nr:hypothetical protein [Rhodobacterales bacterium]